jgi:hypothetical protein
MKLLRTLLLCLTCAVPAIAMSQWQWIDSAGRKVYSDQPPPPEVPQRNIQRQPGMRSSAPVVITPVDPVAPATPVAATTPAKAASGAAPAGRDKDLEARRKQLEAAEADKRKAEEDRIAKQRADNCVRVQQAKRTLDSGVRMARMNDKGEQEILDDAGRAVENKRINELMASECSPAKP